MLSKRWIVRAWRPLSVMAVDPTWSSNPVAFDESVAMNAKRSSSRFDVNVSPPIAASWFGRVWMAACWLAYWKRRFFFVLDLDLDMSFPFAAASRSRTIT